MKEQILQMLRQGAKQHEVASALSVSKQYVHTIARKSGLALTREEHRKARDAAKREKASLVSTLLEEGKGYKEVADTLGIRTTEVRKLLGMDSSLGHGGVRSGSGRAPNPEKKIRIGISITNDDRQELLNLGQGNASRGVAVAVRIAKQA